MRKYILLFLIFLALPNFSFVSTNVPLDHWSYDAIDKLIGQGLIDGSMMTTRPVSRFEMARNIAEADDKFQRLNVKNNVISDVIERLKKEFQPELGAFGTVDGGPVLDYVKPVDDLYLKYVYGQSRSELENIRGDQFDKNSNLRAGFISRGQFLDKAAFYVHPEYPYSTHDSSQDVQIIEAYGKLMMGKFEIEVGKDSLWWGPGYHGSLIMSNNTEPFNMVKLSNPTPIGLPWIFKALGPFKVVFFLTRLEEDRPIPEPMLSGMRINFKPHPAIELGLSRAIIFGGSGRSGLGLKDYLDIFFATKENRPGKLDNDQLAGFDASLLLPVDWLMPAKSIKLYTDFTGEDEAGGLPSSWGKLYGAKIFDIFKTGKTDLTMEYANNHVSGKPNVFYNHDIYQAGYTYRDRIIGHYMGSDAEDLFLRLTHYISSNIIVGLQYDRVTSNLSASSKPTIDQVQFDITLFAKQSWQLNTAYRHVSTKNTPLPNNNIILLQVTYDF